MLIVSRWLWVFGRRPTTDDPRPMTNDSSVRLNNSPDSSRSALLGRSTYQFGCLLLVAVLAQILRNHVNVFQPRAGVEQHNFLAALEEPFFEQTPVSSQRRS